MVYLDTTFAGNLKAKTLFSKLTQYGLAAALFWRAFQLRCSCSLTIYGQANNVNILLPGPILVTAVVTSVVIAFIAIRYIHGV